MFSVAFIYLVKSKVVFKITFWVFVFESSSTTLIQFYVPLTWAVQWQKFKCWDKEKQKIIFRRIRCWCYFSFSFWKFFALVRLVTAKFPIYLSWHVRMPVLEKIWYSQRLKWMHENGPNYVRCGHIRAKLLSMSIKSTVN